MSFDRYSIPNVGLALIIRNSGKVLLGQRQNSHASGTWAFPGGHLELWEEPEDCVLRELREEVGEEITVTNLRKGTFTNDMFKDYGRHFTTLFMISDYVSGEPKIMEPDKCRGWKWFSWSNLPRPLMLPIENMIKGGYDPFVK